MNEPLPLTLEEREGLRLLAEELRCDDRPKAAAMVERALSQQPTLEPAASIENDRYGQTEARLLDHSLPVGTKLYVHPTERSASKPEAAIEDPANPLAVSEGGAKWVPFIVEFQTQEGAFSFELWAVDMGHALERLEELKATAKISGELHGRIKHE